MNCRIVDISGIWYTDRSYLGVQAKRFEAEMNPTHNCRLLFAVQRCESEQLPTTTSSTRSTNTKIHIVNCRPCSSWWSCFIPNIMGSCSKWADELTWPWNVFDLYPFQHGFPAKNDSSSPSLPLPLSPSPSSSPSPSLPLLSPSPSPSSSSKWYPNSPYFQCFSQASIFGRLRLTPAPAAPLAPLAIVELRGRSQRPR